MLSCLSVCVEINIDVVASYTAANVLSNILLTVDEETAAEDACRIEHVISEKSFAAMQRHMAEMGSK